MRMTDEGIRVEPTIPDADATDAALLTLRMFNQNNEPFSLCNVARLAATDPGISAEWKDWFNHYRDTLNQHLDSGSRLVLDGERPTNRDIFEAFLYGEMAHTNAAKPAALATWRRDAGPVFPLVETLFAMVIVDFLNVIFQIVYITRAELEGQPIPPFSPP
jgi:hypothetical protein